MLVRFLLLLTVLSCSTCCYADQAADEFWRAFRQAVMNGEPTKAAEMTNFPLWVRGPDDSDPVYYYERDEFLPIYKRLLDQNISVWTGDKVVSKTMYQVIKEKKQLESQDYNTDSQFGVENFEFLKVKGKWRFTKGYLEDAGGR